MVDTTPALGIKAFHCSRTLTTKSRLHTNATRERKSSQRMVIVWSKIIKSRFSFYQIRTAYAFHPYQKGFEIFGLNEIIYIVHRSFYLDQLSFSLKGFWKHFYSKTYHVLQKFIFSKSARIVIKYPYFVFPYK